MTKSIKGLPRDDAGKILPQFTANGKKYFIESSLNIKRFSEFEKIQLEVGFGISFSDVFDRLKQGYDLANKQKFADLSVMLYNMMHGIKKASTERYNSALTMCTLFINTEEEDRTTWSIDLAEKKLKDWSDEGFDVRDFFLLAVSSIDNFAQNYKELTADIFTNKSKETVKS